MAMTSMNTRSIILRSFTMRVGIPQLKMAILETGRGLQLTSLALDTREEDLKHPEDIEHFRKHDEQEAAAEHQEEMDRMPIVEQNIPQKFRRY